ncbi:post-transcriptional RNA stability regulator Mkt1 [Schizosaccharomyces osmophilus]|uniref:Post-transcriptional RNA stability regulator Mkt1 n=1 Tax=Schizosaccharomyces osmophilus TaxID=2545709 RepID=A0AAE9WA42_9SCHI|nr:post-transcriptional RNA stability regulator Mkt1 [Schizosaccharomyces osmophilus]WBW72009.1 post-transcriptional RNA stability regulator Mkt1 [Schizosaccharomyces osmophilus]
MTIHSLELFLIKNRHEFTCNISQIANRKLGIDASYFLIELLRRLSAEELQAISVDGESEILNTYVNSFLDVLKNYSITPLFVFNGIPLTFEASGQGEASRKQSKLSRMQYSLSSFDPYDANIHTNLYRMDPDGNSHRNQSENRRTFLYSNQRDSLDRLCDFLKKILDTKDIDYFVAPYLAMAQLSYFQGGASKSYVDAVYGPEDLLLFDVKRPILSITIPYLQSESFRSSLSNPQQNESNKQSSTIQWLDGDAIFQDSRCASWSQFVEACLLCGTSISPTLPQFEGTFLLKSSIELVTMLGSAYRVVEGFADTMPSGSAQELLQQYRRSFCYLNYCIIMNEKGIATPPVPENSVPTNINAIMGTRLPNELYYYISRGLLPSRMISALVSGCFSDPVSILEQHIANYSSQESAKPEPAAHKNAVAMAAVNQRRFVDDLEEIWSQGLNLLTQPLHRFYQARDVISLHGHNQQASLKVMRNYDPPLYNDTRAWMIYDECIPLGIKKAVSENKPINIHNMLDCLRDKNFVEKSFCSDTGIGIKNPPKRLLSTTSEIVLSSFYRFLQIRSFVSTTHQLTSWGSPLLMALEKCNVQYQSSMCVLFELLRLRQIKEPGFDSATSSTLHIPSVIEFLSKLATFLPIGKETIYQLFTPDRDLLQFYMMQTSFGANLHELAAILIASVIMNANADRNLVNPYSIRKTFPFRRNFCSLLSGIFMNELLQTLSRSDNDMNKEVAIETTFKKLKEDFPYVTDAKAFLSEFLDFWAAFMEGVKVAENTSAIGKLVASKLYLTNDWLESLKLV